MNLFRSYRSKLLASFFALGLLAIIATHWQASRGATTALRQNTYERLTAIRETKRRLIEDYFRDLTNHVLALSADESSIVALERFQAAWDGLPSLEAGDERYEELLAHYREVSRRNSDEPVEKWFPSEPRTRGLQHLFIAANPHPIGLKDLLLQPENGGEYGRIHARYHPTLHRYQTSFGFYDIFLISARDGRILYSVFKEVDLGQRLTAPPYRETALGEVFARAMATDVPETAVIQDYAPYLPSDLTPAAFVAAPIWRAGAKIGVLGIQVSIEHVNRVMTGDRRWETEGMGESGHAYIVGADRKLRSDVRFEIAQPEAFFQQLRTAGVSTGTIDRIRHNRTAILNLALPEHVAERLRTSDSDTEIGHDFRNVDVLRSHAPLRIPGLDWTLVAEMEEKEAFGPISALRRRMVLTGVLITALFLAAASVLGRSVTKPVLALAEGTRRLAGRDFRVRLPIETSDEIGQLAASFNQMAEDLDRTTVSRDELDRANQELSLKKRELEHLNARLITAQEEERSRLARELHDDLTQRLAAAAIAAGSLKLLPDSEGEKLRAGLEKIQADLAQISKDIHGLSRRLHSSTLQDLGLVAAIEGECRGFFERGGAPVDFTHSGELDSVSKDAQLALYRIVQEALRNIFRHAEATEVQIRLARQDDEVAMEIADNGRGFSQNGKDWKPGLGLASMAERARLLGGSAVVRSRPGAGSTISVHVPVAATV